MASSEMPSSVAMTMVARGIQHVVQAGHVHRDVQRLALRAQHGEPGAHAFLADVDRAHVGVFAEAVGHGRAGDLREDLTHNRIIHAHHRQSVERQVVEELDEGLLQLVEVAAVGRHVVGVDIGDHRDHRLQVQEAGVALVGLGHQVEAGAELGVGPGGVQPAADDEGRVQPPAANTEAIRLVVVVLPWVPATAMPCR